MHGYGVSFKLVAETLELGECGFGLCFMGVVDLGMREGESDHFHRVGHGSHSWGG